MEGSHTPPSHALAIIYSQFGVFCTAFMNSLTFQNLVIEHIAEVPHYVEVEVVPPVGTSVICVYHKSTNNRRIGLLIMDNSYPIMAGVYGIQHSKVIDKAFIMVYLSRYPNIADLF
ncbi:uncharacterized protein G2W53_039489 [Senna tora]|uniref:Uncharacterized protein n=1 Tax=Senna tora TaxID=362788 RepID=A0A834SQP7_9FABA|nr:uncharacterized protein G2W53_039489 [Senna tora]